MYSSPLCTPAVFCTQNQSLKVPYSSKRFLATCHSFFDLLCFFVLDTSRHRCSVGDPDPEPDPDPQGPHVYGPPGSRSGSINQWYGSGSGSFPFLISVLSTLKQCLQNNFNTKFLQKIKFFRPTMMCLWARYKRKYGKILFFFASLKSMKKGV
jgi:hypothetical protein